MDNGLIFPYHLGALRVMEEREVIGLRTTRNVRLNPRSCLRQIRDTKAPEAMTSLIAGEVAESFTKKIS